MTDIRIARLNITVNAIKIVSLWVCTLGVSWKLSSIWSDVKTKLETYDTAVKDVKELKEWRTKVTAYYLPQKQSK